MDQQAAREVTADYDFLRDKCAKADSKSPRHAHDSFPEPNPKQMLTNPTGWITAILLPTAARRSHPWLFHLGGVGLIPLGLLDNSLIPIPGTMVVATIVLSAQ
ncbi:MAG: hypothetical protein WA857_15775 [Candidatus Acidiferrum sp.]